MGIGYWEGAVCEASLAGITRAIFYAIGIAGIDQVGLGSDFDGGVTAAFDADGLPQLTAYLLAAGLSQADLEQLLGANLRRVLSINLPD